MSPAHTPGPWQCAPISYMRSKHISHWAIAASEPVAVVYPHLLASEANARLIAAGPDLLAAARLAVEWAEQVPAPYRDWPHVAAARAAIAKARG